MSAFPKGIARVSVELNERELSCIRWAGVFVSGMEEEWPEQAGTREGEAMSDVLAGIVSRAERLLAQHTKDRRAAADQYAAELADELGLPRRDDPT